VVAGCTTSLGLVPGVLLAPLRPAVLLAKSAGTLDVLSGGRLELGIGVGWQREEYAALDIPFAGRWTRADDTLAACRALWEQLPASVATGTVTFTRVYAAPQPTRRIPITIGAAATDATVQRIARWGDGWFPLGVDPAGLRDGVDRVRAGFIEAGRDPDSLVVRAQGIVRMRGTAVDATRMADELVELRRSGATAVWYALSPGLGVSGLAAADELLHAIAAALGPAACASIT
jgi:probable F420-dependent oxidoreductase